MNKLKVSLATLVLLPMLAFGSSLASADLGALPDEGVSQELGGTESYECCWIFFMGRWWCAPCG